MYTAQSSMEEEGCYEKGRRRRGREKELLHPRYAKTHLMQVLVHLPEKEEIRFPGFMATASRM